MTDEQIALARRAVACSGWKWLPGMLTSDGFRVCRVDTDGYKFGYHTEYNYAYAVVGDVLPDLEDPATLGCLLALVREAWWQDDMGASRYKDQWSAEVTPQEAPNYAFYAFYGASEVEALVAALEAAP